MSKLQNVLQPQYGGRLEKRAPKEQSPPQLADPQIRRLSLLDVRASIFRYRCVPELGSSWAPIQDDRSKYQKGLCSLR